MSGVLTDDWGPDADAGPYLSPRPPSPQGSTTSSTLHTLRSRIVLQAREPGLQLDWSPCHLPPKAQMERLSKAERLWAVQETLKAFGFLSVSDVLQTELQIDGAISVGRRTSRFYEGGDCIQLLSAITRHPKFDIRKMLLHQDFQTFAKDFIGKVCNTEFRRLVVSPKLQRRLFDFSPSQFENVEIFKEIEEEQHTLAPIFTYVIQLLSRVDIGRTDKPSDLRYVPDIVDGPLQEKVTKALRNRRLISIVAVQLIAYAHTKYNNLLQGLLGIYLYSTNTSKRTIEALHQFGLSCGYDAILRGLRATAKAAMQVLVERTHEQRFFISYDNMNFYKHVRDQRSHNRAHQTNYTAGYILFMDSNDQLPSSSVDYAAALRVRNDELLPSCISRGTSHYDVHAAEYNISNTLRRYCRNTMSSQKDTDGKPLYTVCDPPLAELRANSNRADFMTFPTLDCDEASIDGTIAVLKELTRLLDLKPCDVNGKCIMLNGDYLTVRNVTRAICRRQEHKETIHNFSYFEPVAGLFHLQMNTLKMLMHVFEGSRSDPGSLTRFASLLRRKSVGKEVKDFHGCNEFFNQVLDGHILALVMREVHATSLEEMKSWLRCHDWPVKFNQIARKFGNILAVEEERSKVFDNIQVHVEARLATAMAEREGLRRARVVERRETGRNSAPLPPVDWKKEELRMRKELGAGAWDNVWQNAWLLVIAGLVYRDFSDACRDGYSGRVEKCIEKLMLMFQGSRFKNYAAECLHLVICLKRTWKPEFRKVWQQYSLIKPSPKDDYWCATDRHGETIIRGNKDKVRPSANAQGDEFLREVIGPNIPSLEAVRQMVYKASGASAYGNQHHEVDAFVDVAQITNALTQEDVFTFTKGRGTPGGSGNPVDEAIDLVVEGIARIATGVPLMNYKRKSRANWGSQGFGQSTTASGEEQEWEDVDALEGHLSGPGVLDDEDVP